MSDVERRNQLGSHDSASVVVQDHTLVVEVEAEPKRVVLDADLSR
jgi:hypothetical protein